METPAAATFTLAYLVLAVCFVFPPSEFHLAGLTVQNLLGGWLGSEDAAFVQYHLRRGAGTLLAHAALPLGEGPPPHTHTQGLWEEGEGPSQGEGEGETQGRGRQ